ncbi:MAG TPA: hypothetical protein DCQ31_16250 [Bacteroidales bacterium]|nr:hypothetical protein [Bacteroidales bacterium]
MGFYCQQFNSFVQNYFFMQSEENTDRLAIEIQQKIAEVNGKYSEPETKRFVLLHDLKTLLSNKLGVAPYEFLIVPDFNSVAEFVFQQKNKGIQLFCTQNHALYLVAKSRGLTHHLSDFNPTHFPEIIENKTNWFFVNNVSGTAHKRLSTKKFFKQIGECFSILQIENYTNYADLKPYFSAGNADITFFVPQIQTQGIPKILWFNFEKKANTDLKANLYKMLLESEKQLNFDD